MEEYGIELPPTRIDCKTAKERTLFYFIRQRVRVKK